MNSAVESRNLDPAEQAKFEQLAARWWDREGEFRPLHDLNPARQDYVAQRAPLRHSKVLDVGCGGGILSESLAAAGAQVTAIDVAEKALAVARLHGLESELEVDYRQCTVEELAQSEAGGFSAITCMEML
ncbi:MAG TPA: 3-demethylubiquinone-9 3-O-methyltransferase, partial [Chromatiales bacterium]|nr:3-demethylubiquinone-9 3-O-methyltransferase [Chromatiales bacterium]